MASRRALALGISPHTGWAACVVVSGTLAKPVIVQNVIVDVLGDEERFCFHMAAEMPIDDARAFIARTKKKALANAKRALAPLMDGVKRCAIVAKDRDPGTLDQIVAAHPRIHTAEGCLYRDVFAAACASLGERATPVHLVDPRTIDDAKAKPLAKTVGPPWGKDQRLAALAAWSLRA